MRHKGKKNRNMFSHLFSAYDGLVYSYNDSIVFPRSCYCIFFNNEKRCFCEADMTGRFSDDSLGLLYRDTKKRYPLPYYYCM
jgi:hypothetical protein